MLKHSRISLSTTGALGTGTVVPAAAKNDNLDILIARVNNIQSTLPGHSIAADGAYGIDSSKYC